MSFNIRGWFPSANDGINEWKNRAALNIETIKSAAPDIIGFQELQQRLHLKDYKRELRDYNFFLGNPYNNEEPTYCWPAIFW